LDAWYNRSFPCAQALKKHCVIDEATEELLDRAIADPAGADAITGDQVSEAVQYRSLDRQWWG
jgi:hypothetical protein